MKNLKLFGTFLEKAMHDPRLAPCHISLYVGIFQRWVTRNFQSPMNIAVDEMMKRSKLSGRATYYRAIRELHKFGYIEYLPGNHRREQSQVKMTKLDSIKYLLLLVIKFKVRQVMT